MARVHVRAYAAGRCAAGADAPDEFAKVVQSSLQRCIRLTPYVDKRALAEELMRSGMASDVAQRVAESAEITDDEAYFSNDWPS
jgi:hypothetical protein